MEEHKNAVFRTNINLNNCATLWKLPEPIGARLDGDMIYTYGKRVCMGQGGVTVIVTMVTVDKIDESAYLLNRAFAKNGSLRETSIQKTCFDGFITS